MKELGTKLVIFDMDGVLTQHASSWQYVHEKMGVDNRANYELFKKKEISYEKFLETDVELWNSVKGRVTRSDIVTILGEIPLRENLKSAMERLRNRKCVMAIVSGGISWLADRINSIFPFDYVYSNSILTDGDGGLIPVGNPVVDPLRKDATVLRLQHELGLGPEDTVSIGDTIQDVSMFRLSGFSVAFNSMDSGVSRNSTVSLNSNNLEELADIIEEHCLNGF